MEHNNANTIIIDGYLRLLENLSLDDKLDLISRLTVSVNVDSSNRKSTFKKSFGAFQSKKSADEIIKEIHSSRKFKRIIEKI